MEHFVSNLQVPVHIGVIVMMVLGDFGWGNIILYTFYAGVNWFLYRFFGMGKIKFLRPNYPYLNSNLNASIFYLIGMEEYQTTYPFMDVEWPTKETETSDLVEEVDTSEANDGEVVVF